MFGYIASALFCAVLMTVVNCDVLKNYEVCESSGKLTEVRIVPCPESPCILKKNSNVGLEIDFQTSTNYKLLDKEAQIKKNGRNVTKRKRWRIVPKSGMEVKDDLKHDESSESLEIQMFGVLGAGIPEIPWNGVPKLACDHTTDSSGHPACSVKDGSQVLHYKNSFKVMPAYPTIPLTVKVVIKDSSKNTPIVCFTFPVKIEN